MDKPVCTQHHYFVLTCMYILADCASLSVADAHQDDSAVLVSRARKDSCWAP